MRRTFCFYNDICTDGRRFESTPRCQISVYLLGMGSIPPKGYQYFLCLEYFQPFHVYISPLHFPDMVIFIIYGIEFLFHYFLSKTIFLRWQLPYIRFIVFIY